MKKPDGISKTGLDLF